MTEVVLTTLPSSISEPMTWKGLRLSAIAKSRTTIGGRTVIVPLLPGATGPGEAGLPTTGVTGGRTIGGGAAGRAAEGVVTTTGGRSVLG
ncbi:MAG: hypothetical protein RJA37_700, partial [Verrucomicrobiota bacterium]